MRRLTAALFLLASVGLSAQQYDDTVTVNVVEVPVHVERFGIPIAGLTRDDFKLFVNGAPHPIDYFDVIDGEAENIERTSAAPADRDLNRRHLVVLAFDMTGTSAYGLFRARKMAAEFVNERSGENAYAVAVIARTGVRFVVPFTTDRVAVTRAIGTLSRSKARDPFHVATLEVERDAWGGESGGIRLPSFNDPARARLDLELERDARFLEEWLFTDDLAALADQLAPLSGIKRVVLLTERPGVTDPLRPYDPAERVREHFRTAGVILDGIDVRLPRVPGGMASSQRPAYEAPDLLLSGLLYSLTAPTGGTVDASLRGLQKRNRFTYVLGFRPPPSPERTGSIRVRLKDQRLFTEVRHRQSYTLGEPDPKDKWLFLADTLLNDIPQRGVTLDLDVQRTSVVATIPGVELLAYPNYGPLMLEVFFYVFDSAGQPAAWKHVRVELDLVKGRDFLGANPYTVRQQFELPPGRYAAKAIVRVVGTNKTGFAREDFEVAAD